MANYESKTTGWWAFALAGLLAIAGLGLAVFQGMEGRPAAIIGIVMILAASIVASFGVLTVRVTQEDVTWCFGLGPFRQRIALDRVRSVETRRTPWYWGWGIRWTPRGWLWRASGLDTVWLERDGGKWIGVGTHDPEGLTRAIREGMGLAARGS